MNNNMIIYKITQVSTGKIYIGSLKNIQKWENYNSSSKLVKSLIKENSNDFIKEILLTFSDAVTFAEVVTLEQKLIQFYFNSLGKDSMLNKGYYKQQAKLYGRNKPKTAFKKGQIPWNKGLKGVQKSTRKGKTFDQIHGNKAQEIINKRQESRGNKGYRKVGEYIPTNETKEKIRQSILQWHNDEKH